MVSVRPSASYVPAVVGHSAGGATAYLTAMDLGKKIGVPKAFGDNVKVRYLITYGAPRVGNVAFVEELQKHVGTQHGTSEGWRCIQSNDPIPYSVPRFLGYVHALPAVLLFADQSYRVCRPPDVTAWLIPEDPTCFGSGIDTNDHMLYF